MDDPAIQLHAIEIEILLAALEFYERRIKNKRSAPMVKAVRTIRRKLTIAAQQPVSRPVIDVTPREV
jgi:hypothetical protein